MKRRARCTNGHEKLHYRDLCASLLVFQNVDMNLPRSITQPLLLRVLVLMFATMNVATLSLDAQTPAPPLTCTPSNLHFGEVPISGTETQLVVLTNTASNTVTVSSMAMSGAEFSISNLSLPLTLSAGQSASFNVTFKPTANGWEGGVATFTSSAGPMKLWLAGTGVAADAITANPSTLSFNNVKVGSSSTQSVVLTNGRSQTTINNFQMSNSEFTVSGPSTPLTLSAGQTITLNVTFTPQSAGIAGGSVFAGGPRLNVPLTGTGTTSATGQLTVTPALLNFGNVPVGTTSTQPMTISATGAAVTVSSDSSSSAQYVLNGAAFPLTIPAGQSASFNVAFTPTNSGTVAGALVFSSNASDAQASESLTGTGTAQVYSVNLWWNAANDVVGYNVYRSTSATGSYAKVNSSLDPTTAYTDSGVASGQTYYYEATSVNSTGMESAKSTPPVVAAVP